MNQSSRNLRFVLLVLATCVSTLAAQSDTCLSFTARLVRARSPAASLHEASEPAPTAPKLGGAHVVLW
jgi:hypothetical protein